LVILSELLWNQKRLPPAKVAGAPSIRTKAVSRAKIS
jgi:hypothetical protein